MFEEAQSDRSISEVTRRDIFDAIRDKNISFCGRLSEIDFLSRLYDLDSLPSHDPKVESARKDIWQHTENNPGDWPVDWVFTDSRFDLLHSSDKEFLLFLCEMIHPVVRPDSQLAVQLANTVNQHLLHDGWKIVATTFVSDKPVFTARRRGTETAALNAAKPVASSLDSPYIWQQITRMETSIEPDPELAIGTAKEFVETVCKTILHECGETVSKGADLPQLVKQVRERLELLPDSVPEKSKGAETIKRLLNNLGTVAQGIAELRGLYGSGHGKDAKAKGLQPRHARLAVNAAATLGVFIFDTYQERKGNK